MVDSGSVFDQHGNRLDPALGPESMQRTMFDVVIVGGGHNGLGNGAYLAKGGLRTLVLERRPMVGGAAITEELRPGFRFTTFSYALSLLRPQIIQELELTKHGFLPLLMSTRFAPGEDGDYLLFNRDHDETLREIARLSPHDADAYEQYGHDLDRVCQAIKPLFDMVPPDGETDPLVFEMKVVGGALAFVALGGVVYWSGKRGNVHRATTDVARASEE
jgi:phytoene dehydrogenase-like protein